MSSLLGLWYRWWGWDEFSAGVYGTGGGVGMRSAV